MSVLLQDDVVVFEHSPDVIVAKYVSYGLSAEKPFYCSYLQV